MAVPARRKATSRIIIFTVYAVDEEKLQFAKDHNVSAAVVGFELHFHGKAKGSLTATYGR
jgi:phosphatidylethanolamine-binding protein (PEBP) family uncharacterized protein